MRIHGNNPAGGQSEDEMSKMWNIESHVAYRDPSETDHLPSYIHAVVESNRPTNAFHSMTDADFDEDILAHWRNEKDDQTLTFADQSLSNANEHTKFNFYFSLIDRTHA